MTATIGAALSTREKLAQVEAEICSEVIGRNAIVRAIIRAVLARQHVMLIGPPGNAKTMTFERLFQRITGAKVFNTLITPYTSADEVMGPASIRTLRDEDRIERNVDGMFPDADYAIMDEFWNMPETLAASLLRGMNERQVFNGNRFIDIPLRTMVAASNHLPHGEGFLAATDRIVVRIHLPAPKIREADLFQNILQSTLLEREPLTVSMEEIDAATTELMGLPVTPEFYDFLTNELRPALTKADLGLTESSISVRRWKEAIKLARAEAWLRGDDEVRPEHAVVYRDVCWNKEHQISDVQSLIDKMVGGPSTLDGNTLMDELKSIVEQHAADMAQAETLGDIGSSTAAITNKTKYWDEKLREVKEDWYVRFRKADDFEERMGNVELANQMMAGRAKSAYDEVMDQS